MSALSQSIFSSHPSSMGAKATLDGAAARDQELILPQPGINSHLNLLFRPRRRMVIPPQTDKHAVFSQSLNLPLSPIIVSFIDFRRRIGFYPYNLMSFGHPVYFASCHSWSQQPRPDKYTYPWLDEFHTQSQWLRLDDPVCSGKAHAR